MFACLVAYASLPECDPLDEVKRQQLHACICTQFYHLSPSQTVAKAPSHHLLLLLCMILLFERLAAGQAHFDSAICQCAA